MLKSLKSLDFIGFSALMNDKSTKHYERHLSKIRKDNCKGQRRFVFEFHNGFYVDIGCYGHTWFAPCGYNIDNPYNRLVFRNNNHTNWITMNDYEEDDYIDCSPQIMISSKQIENLTFDEVLSYFELEMPNGDIICQEDISKVEISFWEKKQDYSLIKQQVVKKEVSNGFQCEYQNIFWNRRFFSYGGQDWST